MYYKDDFVKYYYFGFQDKLSNNSITVTIQNLTQGFKPSIFALSNDVVNGSFSFTNLDFPSILNYNVKNE